MPQLCVEKLLATFCRRRHLVLLRVRRRRRLSGTGVSTHSRVSRLRIPVRPRLRQIPVKPRLRGPGRMELPADLSWRRRPVAGAGHRLGMPGLAEQAVFQGCRDLNTVGTTVVSAVAGAYAITKVLGGNADGAKGGDR